MTKKMHCVRWLAYGSPSVLRLSHADIPVPKDNQILVKVHASAATTADARLRRFDVSAGTWLATRLVFGIKRPRNKIAGMDFAGEVVATGGKVNRFQIGDRVMGTTGMKLGAHAEYLVIDQTQSVVAMSPSLSYQQGAAIIFGGLTAQYFLADRITPGDQILINGASGSVGCAMIQLAKSLGAHVTSVCSSANSSLVTSLGSDLTIDYQLEAPLGQNKRYQYIIDCVGNLGFQQSKRYLSNNGKFILVNASLRWIIASMVNKSLISGFANDNATKLAQLEQLAASKKVVPVIERTYTLAQIASAHQHIDSGKKIGNVVLMHDA